VSPSERLDPSQAMVKKMPMSEAADGQRVWDGHQFRVVRRCPHGRIRKDLCKPCGGAGICQHNRRRNACGECGGPSMCEHKRPRRRCPECGGKDICEHRLIRNYCRECFKAGTGGRLLCPHQKRKVHCRECAPSRLCKHNKQVRQCKHCSEAGLCKHQKDKGACSECRRESKCRHKKSRWVMRICACQVRRWVLMAEHDGRYTCLQCKEIRASGAAGVAAKAHELLAFLETEHLPPANHPERAAAAQIMDDLLTMALAHAPVPAKPRTAKGAGKEPKDPKEPRERGKAKKATPTALAREAMRAAAAALTAGDAGEAGGPAGGAGGTGGASRVSMYALPSGPFMYPGAVYMCPSRSPNCPGFAGTITSCAGCNKTGAFSALSAAGWAGQRTQGTMPLGMLVGSQGVDAGEGDILIEEEAYTGAGATSKQPEGVVYNSSKGVMYPAALQRLLEGGL